ncbi:MAG TPA: hypothetical protein VGY13_12530 [Solirubrobacteraceae bacterium]|nr:hypothetical protein [Solirubrobacteraceae bacterium]
MAGEHYEWNGPPPSDIAKAPLPSPTVSIAPTSPQSLFYARNLRRAAAALAKRFKSNELILSTALYPSEPEAIVGANGQARIVTIAATSKVKVGVPGTFENAASGITIPELDPRVPERLARLIDSRYRVPTSALGRFALAFFPHELDGWGIYDASGQARFQAYLNGEALERIHR